MDSYLIASSVALPGGAGAAFPSTLLRLSAVVYGACPALCAVPPSGVPRKRGTKSCACFLCPPRLSGSGSQELDGRTLPGCGVPSPSLVPASVSTHASRVRAPSALAVSSPSPRPRWSGACALCLAATLLTDVDHPESQEVFD